MDFSNSLHFANKVIHFVFLCRWRILLDVLRDMFRTLKELGLADSPSVMFKQNRKATATNGGFFVSSIHVKYILNAYEIYTLNV